MAPRFEHHVTLRQLFGGLVDQVFLSELGICSPRLTGYLADLLVDYVHADRIFALTTADGQTIREVSRMQADAMLPQTCSDTERTRVINRYIGDFTLFWTGVYPEALRARRNQGTDRLREYLMQGRRSYLIASELTPPNTDPPSDLLAHLGQEFECCVHGLHRVRESWEKMQQAE